MAVVFSDQNNFLISHKLYIDGVYSKWELNPNLFAINRPYAIDESEENIRRKRTKKKLAESDPFLDNTLIKERFESFIAKCIEEKIIERNPDESVTNKIALRTARECLSDDYSTDSFNGGNWSKKEMKITYSIAEDEYIIPPNCIFFNKDINDIEDFMNNDIKYDVIVMDPPWRNKFIRRLNKHNPQKGYFMLQNEEIVDLPLENKLKDEGIAIIWCTRSQKRQRELLDMLPKWDLKLVAVWHWVKITKYGKPVCEFSNTNKKQPFESIFIAVKTNSDLDQKIDKDRILFSVPSIIHSHKPPLMDLIKPYLKTKTPNCLELFARYLLPNFTSVGLQVLKLQEATLYNEKPSTT